jgi:PAS domain S-box-containing protein
MSDSQPSNTLELLYNISRQVATSLDLHQVLVKVLSLAVQNVGAERGSLIVLDDRARPIDAAIIYEKKLISNKTRDVQKILDQGLAGWVLHNRTTAWVPNTTTDDRWLQRDDDRRTTQQGKSAVCIPLIAREELVGILTIVHPRTDFFTRELVALLQSIADVSSVAIYNARLHDSLQASHRRYREFFQDIITPILFTDKNGQVIEANQAALDSSGYTHAEISQMNISTLHDVDWKRVGDHYTQVFSQNTISYESIFHPQDKDTFPVEIFVKPVEIEGQTLLQWIFQDISERKALDVLRNDLVAMIYHDLRSPLSNVISSLEMMKVMTDSGDTESMRQLLSIAASSTERIQRLVNSLLDSNRIESGQSILNLGAISADELVKDAVRATQNLRDARQSTIQLEVAPNLPPLWVDADMCRRILINLLENAIKFTPNSGLITMGAELDGDFIHFWVQDNGPGIAPEDRDRIFNKFTRLQPGRYPKGIGLGLAFCQLAVRAHGGNIWVTGYEKPGSRFQFTLPIQKADQ